jgi:ubiquitin-protein ligase
MTAIRGSIIAWEPLVGSPPHVDSYSLTVKVRTIVGPGPHYGNETRLRLDLPAAYPFKAAPVIHALGQPYPYHPNWFADGRWCYGKWAPQEGLGQHVIRMVRILQFDPAITNLNSPANGPATSWWSQMLNRGLFPSDRQILPDPVAKKAVIKIVERKDPAPPKPSNIKIIPR